MEMSFCPLYSGSSGNALFVRYGDTGLLIDAGKPGRTLTDALRRIDVAPETLSGILVTHEHSDHVSGVGVMARKYHLPIYATAGTWKGMAGKNLGEIPAELKREIRPEEDFYLGQMNILPFSIPHDAAQPVGYRIACGGMSVSTATDLGHFSRRVFDHIRGSSLVLLESNHDPDLLRANPRYSAWLKQRILGDHGHLSNEACGEALVQLTETGTRCVILGHLSGENNRPDLAMAVSTAAAERAGIRPGKDIRLDIALRDTPGSVYTMRERAE